MLTGEQMRNRWDEAGLDDILDGMSRIEFMVRFTISLPELDTTIIGTKNLDHLRENLAAAQKGPLPEELIADAKRRLAKAGSQPVG
jgi:aryl-alcohol dehydrogenase-like predicted oxidoreductase